jgi:glucosamine--fructose-6-phosphate aminotransferase (isomerizing)
MQSSSTYQEILLQAEAWNDALQAIQSNQAAIKDLWQTGNYDYLIFTGCGSTYYLALAAASLAQSKLKVMSRAVPASELLFHPESIYLPNKRSLLVTISRSALTSETVEVAQDFKNQALGDILVFSCYSDKPLNAFANLNLVAEKGQEISIAQTRSFSSMLLMVELWVNVLAGETIEESLYASADFVESALEFAKPFTAPERFARYFYLGSGARYGIAAEAMLKMKEMSLTSAEAFHPMEFRHGPKSMVDEQTLVIAFLGDKNYEAELAVLNEMKTLGATTLSIGSNADSDYRLSENSFLVHNMPILQALAIHRAIGKGLDPDHPRHLEQVVRLEAKDFLGGSQ